MVCPKCETKIIIDYSQKRQATTDGIYLTDLRVPGFYVSANRIAKRYVSVSICTNCKVILGIGIKD